MHTPVVPRVIGALVQAEIYRPNKLKNKDIMIIIYLTKISTYIRFL